MVKCPACKIELAKAKKTWNYAQSKVQAYTCECGAGFREYTQNNKHCFTLKKDKKAARIWKRV